MHIGYQLQFIFLDLDVSQIYYDFHVIIFQDFQKIVYENGASCDVESLMILYLGIFHISDVEGCEGQEILVLIDSVVMNGRKCLYIRTEDQFHSVDTTLSRNDQLVLLKLWLLERLKEQDMGSSECQYVQMYIFSIFLQADEGVILCQLFYYLELIVFVVMKLAYLLYSLEFVAQVHYLFDEFWQFVYNVLQSDLPMPFLPDQFDQDVPAILDRRGCKDAIGMDYGWHKRKSFGYEYYKLSILACLQLCITLYEQLIIKEQIPPTFLSKFQISLLHLSCYKLRYLRISPKVQKI